MSSRVAVALGVLFGLIVGCCGGFGLGLLATKGGARALEDFVSDEETANVGETKTISRAKFRVEYPGNWTIDDVDEDYDPDHLFSIDSPGSCHVQFVLFDTATDPASSLDAQVSAFVPKIIKEPSQKPMDSWGSFEGKGVILDGSIMGVQRGTVRIFSSADRDKDVTFTVIEFCFDEDMSSVSPGFELVRKSFELK